MKNKFYLKHVAAVLLLFACNYSFAQVQVPKEIKRSISPPTKPSGQTTIRVYDNIITSHFGLNEAVAGKDPAEKALNFINANWQKFGISEKPGAVLKFFENKDLSGTHVIRLRQFYQGLRVDQNEFTITFNKEDKLTAYFNTTIPVKQPVSVNPKIKKEAAEQKVLSYLHPDTVHEKTNELMVHIINFKAYLSYRIDMIATSPAGEWEAYVDANTGEILEIQNIAENLNGTGNVFNTDPVTSAKTRYGRTANFSDNGDMDNADLDRQMISVGLRNISLIGGQYKLQGPFAVISDDESPYLGLYTQPTSDFSFNRSQGGFEATMCYYHIDNSMRYINNTLGIHIMPRQYRGGVQFDPQGLDNDPDLYGAWYLPGSGKLAFGSRATDVDAAEDACVILHELGHGIHHWLIGGSRGSQVEGLSEGCGDYWAKSYERSLGYWTPGDWGYNHVFFWGVESSFPGRSTNYSVPYPAGLSGEVHDDGQLWCSVLMKIYNDIGKEKTDRMFLVGLGYTNGSTNQADAANALYQAAVNLGYSNHELCIIHHHFSATYGSYFTQPAPSSTADIFIQDTPADFGVQVNPDPGPMWVSSDIWVRHTNDGELLHDNPEYSPTDSNYVYVRIHGRGCNTVTGAQLHVYFSKASSGLQWPANWNHFYTATSHGTKLTGDEITTLPFLLPPIAPGEEYIAAIPWFVPNPADFDADIHHFCLLARIVSASDPMYIAETNDINYNTRNNNNIAWKNVSVLNEGAEMLASIFVRPLSYNITVSELSFNSPKEPWNPGFNQNGKLYLTLREPLYSAWLSGGKIGDNYTEIEPGKFLVKNQKFYLGGFKLNVQQTYLADVLYKPYKNGKACVFDLIQSTYDSLQKKVVTGGERFEYRKKAAKNEAVAVTAGGKDQSDIAAKTIDEHAKKQVTVYPNPVNDMLTISANGLKDAKTICVLDTKGNKLIELPAPVNFNTTGTEQLKTGSLNAGIYFIQIKNSKNEIIASEKIVKL